MSRSDAVKPSHGEEGGTEAKSPGACQACWKILRVVV